VIERAKSSAEQVERFVGVAEVSAFDIEVHA